MSLEKVIDDKISNLLIKIDKQKLPKHIAIIMDGNGRWATRKGLPRSFGHKQGVSVLKKILKAAKNLGCKVITVYAFSTENWTRPTKEVDFLINLFSEVLKNEIKEINEESTKIKFIGDLTPFPKNLKEIISSSESLTKNNNKFLFNVCVNYGGRQEIVKVAKELALKSSAGEIKPSFKAVDPPIEAPIIFNLFLIFKVSSISIKCEIIVEGLYSIDAHLGLKPNPNKSGIMT